MFRKLLLISAMLLGLAACETSEQLNLTDLINFGGDEAAENRQWYRDYLTLYEDMDNPSSSAFQEYAAAAKATPDFETSIVTEFDTALGAVLANVRATPELKRKQLNTISRSLGLLAKHRLVSPLGVDQMYGSFDRQTAAAYTAGRLPLGMHDTPPPLRQLPAAIVRRPQAAFHVTWREVLDGDYTALGTLLEIGRKLATEGNNQIERMTFNNLRQAQLPFEAWSGPVMEYFPDLARARLGGMETPLVARFEFKNRALGQETHQRLLKLMPDVYFVSDPKKAAGVLIIREVAFQTTAPKVAQENRTLSRVGFSYHNRNEYPNITGADWVEKTTEMSGNWAIQVQLSKPGGAPLGERIAQGDKTVVAVECLNLVYAGFGDNKPDGWPNEETTKRCETGIAPVTDAAHFRGLAIDAAMDAVLSLVGPLRRVPQTNPR